MSVAEIGAAVSSVLVAGVLLLAHEHQRARGLPGPPPAPLVDAAARRLHATHRVSYRERQEAVRTIVANVVPLS